jgi:hypothetical protein
VGASAQSALVQRQCPSLRLVILGDKHELHRETNVPHDDILIHVGTLVVQPQSERNRGLQCLVG